jgi:uncharacterized membrane protein YqhA
MMVRFLLGSRFLILVPIIGLTLAAGAFFILGGVGLIATVIEVLSHSVEIAQDASHASLGTIIFEVVEYVHTFLVGTVLYITAVGLFQLFVKEIPFPDWLKVKNTEELETNLIGVTVVVLAVNFMGETFIGLTDNLLQYGAGIALPIAALALFVGLRAWSNRISQAHGESGENSISVADQKSPKAE